LPEKIASSASVSLLQKGSEFHSFFSLLSQLYQRWRGSNNAENKGRRLTSASNPSGSSTPPSKAGIAFRSSEALTFAIRKNFPLCPRMENQDK
jgi:hypothetical protein